MVMIDLHTAIPNGQFSSRHLTWLIAACDLVNDDFLLETLSLLGYQGTLLAFVLLYTLLFLNLCRFLISGPLYLEVTPKLSLSEHIRF